MTEQTLYDTSYDSIQRYYEDVRLAYIIYTNHGALEDRLKFEAKLDHLIGMLIASLMTNRSFHGAGDVLFAGILYRMDRRMDVTVAKPMSFHFEGLSLVLIVNPLLYWLYFENPNQMLAGIRQMCLHIIFDHLTAYDWAFRNEDDAKLMNVAMEVEVNQYIEGLPENSVSLDWLKEETENKSLKKREGSLYYFNEMKSVLQNKAKPGHDRMETTFQRMKGSGQLSDLYSQLTGDMNAKNAKDITVEDLEQLKSEMKRNRSMQKIDPDGKFNDLHRKVINGLVKQSYQRMTQEEREGLARQIKEKIKAVTKQRALNWREVIKRGLGNTAVPYKLSRNRVNRRQPFRIDLPGRTLDSSSRLVTFIDTSASQNEEALAYSLSELSNIQTALGTEVWVVQIDSVIQKVDFLNKQTLQTLEFKGRGGTSYAPAYEWLHKQGFTNEDTVAVYFTDGYGDDGFERYGFHNMYWVLTDADPSEPSPLSTDGEGKVLYLRADEKFNHEVMKEAREVITKK